jgi:hypothetical protein
MQQHGSCWDAKQGRKASTSFSEEKEAKRLPLYWAMGVGKIAPMAQSQKSFCAAFFKKRPLA